MSPREAGAPSSTSTTASAARRTVGPRSTSSSPMCVRHRVQAVVCWRLDRLGRNLRHLVMLLDDWQSRGIAFVTMGEGIDTSTPAGRLVAGVLGSIAEFERARIQERIMAGLARARAQGTRLGRRRGNAVRRSMSVRDCRTRRPPHGSMCRSPPSSDGGARRGWGQKGLGDRVISPPFSGRPWTERRRVRNN